MRLLPRAMASANEFSELKKKYELSEKNLRSLMTLSYRAAEDYDKLFKMYDDNQKQYEILKQRLEETEAKLFKLQNALVPACEEYNQLNRHLQIETACRSKLESIAAEVTRENKKLKHQSQALMNKLGEVNCDLKFLETIPDEPETSENSTGSISAAEQNSLNDKITSLEEDVKVLQNKLQLTEGQKESAIKNENDLKNKVKKLEAELLKACKKIQDHDQMVESFKRSSMLALGEYGQLQDMYNKQMFLNQKAEEYAHEMLIQRDAVVRQSSILINSASSDARVYQAMMEIENLTKELETVKKESQGKIKELEEALSSSGDVQKVSVLETELEIASSEANRLHSAVQELEEWKRATMEDMKEMRMKLEEAEDRLRPPPPPPPPPPPACPPPFLSPKLLIVRSPSSVSSTQGSGPPTPKTKDVQLADAMSEMMARIKSGNVALKTASTVRIKKTEPPKAMVELENILKTISSKRSEETAIDSSIENWRKSKSNSNVPPVMPKPLKSNSRRQVEVAQGKPPPSELERKLSQMKEKSAQRLESTRNSSGNNYTLDKSKNGQSSSHAEDNVTSSDL